jgi:hypothetical protein
MYDLVYLGRALHLLKDIRLILVVNEVGASFQDKIDRFLADVGPQRVDSLIRLAHASVKTKLETGESYAE